MITKASKKTTPFDFAVKANRLIHDGKSVTLEYEDGDKEVEFEVVTFYAIEHELLAVVTSPNIGLTTITVRSREIVIHFNSTFSHICDFRFWIGHFDENDCLHTTRLNIPEF